MFTLQITSIDEAKQFYPLFGLGANVALIFSGRTVKFFSEVRAQLPAGVDGWGESLKGMMSIVAGFGIAIVAIYYWMNRVVVPKVAVKKAAGQMGVKIPKKKKQKVVTTPCPPFQLQRVSHSLEMKPLSFALPGGLPSNAARTT